MTKTVLITGTSSGLGRATAKLFHANGWNVVATMRSPEQEAELGQLDRLLVTRLDVQDPGSIDAAVAAGIARFGRIDVLINNAGYGAYGPLEATTLDSVRRQFDVNVLGVLGTTKALLPHLRANRDGAIVNIASIGGKVAFPLGVLYHGTKFAVEGISEALQYELAAFGVRVKLVEPGSIKTDFGGRSLDFSNDPSLTEYQPMVQSVMDAFGPFMENGSTAEQIAEVVYAAALDESGELRFEGGADGKQMLALRRQADDNELFASVKAQFGIA